jgi:hypothetical protein
MVPSADAGFDNMALIRPIRRECQKSIHDARAQRSLDEGHFAEMLESGHTLALLRRLNAT